MAYSVVAPRLGDDVAEPVVAQWHVQDGETVEAGDRILSFEAHHAVVELEAEASGTVHLETTADEPVSPGTVLARIVAPGEVQPFEDGAEDPHAGHEHGDTEPVALAIVEPSSTLDPPADAALGHADDVPLLPTSEAPQTPGGEGPLNLVAPWDIDAIEPTSVEVADATGEWGEWEETTGMEEEAEVEVGKGLDSEDAAPAEPSPLLKFWLDTPGPEESLKAWKAPTPGEWLAASKLVYEPEPIVPAEDIQAATSASLHPAHTESDLKPGWRTIPTAAPGDDDFDETPVDGQDWDEWEEVDGDATTAEPPAQDGDDAPDEVLDSVDAPAPRLSGWMDNPPANAPSGDWPDVPDAPGGAIEGWDRPSDEPADSGVEAPPVLRFTANVSTRAEAATGEDPVGDEDTSASGSTPADDATAPEDATDLAGPSGDEERTWLASFQPEEEADNEWEEDWPVNATDESAPDGGDEGDDLDDPAAWLGSDEPEDIAVPPAKLDLLDVIASTSEDGGEWLTSSPAAPSLPADRVTSHRESTPRAPASLNAHHDADIALTDTAATGVPSGSIAGVFTVVVDADVTATAAALEELQALTDGDGQSTPRAEFAVVRAVAEALAEHEAFEDLGTVVALRVPDQGHERCYVFEDAAGQHIVDLVATAADPQGDTSEAAAVITTYAPFGVRNATPRVGVAPIAIAMGAIRDEVAFEGRAIAPVSRVALTLACDTDLVGDGAAAWLLARVAELIARPDWLRAA